MPSMFHPKGSKQLFVLLIQRHSLPEYDKLWKSGLPRGAPMGRQTPASIVSAYKEMLPEIYEARHPHLHRYNDLFGFAEIWWNGSMELSVCYYFRGDRRTQMGKRISTDYRYPISSQQFYPYREERIGQLFHWLNRNQVREELRIALNGVAATVKKDFRCFVDISHELELIRCLDLNSVRG